jgi:hypothetical protein
MVVAPVVVVAVTITITITVADGSRLLLLTFIW